MTTDAGVRAKKLRLIEAYQEVGTITAAAKLAGVHRSQHYDWIRLDEEYTEQFQHAEQSVADMLEQEAIRRAVQGTDKPVYQGGQLVGTVRQYSDTLLIFLLNGLRPEKYKYRSFGQVDVKVTTNTTFDEQVSELVDEVRRLEGTGKTSGSPRSPS